MHSQQTAKLLSANYLSPKRNPGSLFSYLFRVKWKALGTYLVAVSRGGAGDEIRKGSFTLNGNEREKLSLHLCHKWQPNRENPSLASTFTWSP